MCLFRCQQIPSSYKTNARNQYVIEENILTTMVVRQTKADRQMRRYFHQRQMYFSVLRTWSNKTGARI